jgi:PAS domain S-box-containing protein
VKLDNDSLTHNRTGGAHIKDDELLRTFTDNLKEALLALDSRGCIVFWNKGAERILGYTEQEVLGKNAVELLSGEGHQPEYQGLLRSYLKTGVSIIEQESAEFAALTRNGTMVPIEVSTSHMELEGELYFIVVFRDLTHKKEAERALQESEARYRLVENNLTDVIWMTDLEFKLTYISPSLFFQTGFKPEEVLSQSLGMLITPESLQNAFKVLAEELSRADETYVNPPIPVGMLVEQYRKDGSTFWSEVRAGFLRRPDGTPYGGLGISRDITERIQLEEKEREKAAALAAADVSKQYAAELKNIITIAAHELRLPATVFKGYSNILLEHRDELDADTVNKALTEIYDASTRLNNLVADLFETSLIEQGRMSLNRTPIAPASLIRMAKEGLSHRRPGGRLNFRRCEEKYPIEVDSERVCRILMVLMDNALKYSPEGSRVEAWFEQDEQETTYHVLDQGPGIPEADREKVFLRFYQVGDVDHHSHTGLGLGLHIARSIVELHGGWIKVEPGNEGGSHFSFGLPRSF